MPSFGIRDLICSCLLVERSSIATLKKASGIQNGCKVRQPAGSLVIGLVGSECTYRSTKKNAEHRWCIIACHSRREQGLSRDTKHDAQVPNTAKMGPAKSKNKNIILICQSTGKPPGRHFRRCGPLPPSLQAHKEKKMTMTPMEFLTGRFLILGAQFFVDALYRGGKPQRGRRIALNIDHMLTSSSSYTP